MSLSAFRGKVVLVDFWANWCPHCRVMYDYERALVKKMAGRPFVLLGVNSDSSMEVYKGAMEKENLPWRSLWSDGSPGSVNERWQVTGIPTLFLIDPQGDIYHKWEGRPDEKALDAMIEKLVQETEKIGKKRP